ncbi:MAG: acetyl/propionyl/methylcrotonyl-CoA carboxylase subunit alpha [Bdellovibrionales bacterium]
MSRLRKIEKVAIANRGEVAVRIIRACQELGIETVLLHSEADANTPAARLADEPVCVGASDLNDSYLNIQANVENALSRGADAIHPGFGFLSENAEFAKACEDRGLIFIGPSPDAIRLFGDKISAKRLVQKAGGPVIPGYDGDDQEIECLLGEAKKIGYPVIVKATAGGGGRGLKVIRSAPEAREQIESAQREGMAAFGSAKVFLEKYLGHAKHIEVQIFGDASGKIHVLGERECSIQRRHQKIIEEAPCAQLSPALRLQMHDTAKAIGEQASYCNAGTVEFLLQDGKFYFMEMNTRLQVEHPVTEMTFGVDLVKGQILTAMGKAVGWTPREALGHAIECRIYAENPYQGGIPSTGLVGSCLWPAGPGRRFEVGVEAGDQVTSFYDSMIAKVVVWDETRARAIQKMQATLRETMIFGVHTNIPLLQEILRHPEFMLGDMTTRFFEEHFPQALKPEEPTRLETQLLEKVRRQIGEAATASSITSPWTHQWGGR